MLRIVKLSKRAWALPILALMARGVPGRQAQLLAQTTAGRTAFAQSLAHLVEMGMLRRAPGHGHPLRPEFQLTDEGRVLGARAAAVIALTPGPEAAALLRKTWILPALLVLDDAKGFGALRRDLAPVTDRALSLTLKQMEAAGWVQRRIDSISRPPRTLYRPSIVAQRLRRAWEEAAAA